MSISQANVDALLAEAERAADQGDSGARPAATATAGRADGAAHPGARASQSDINRILRLEVPVSVTLAQRDLDIESLLEVKVGTIIEFEARFDADLSLDVAGHPIGRGQAVKVGENFGLRVTGIEDVHERIEAMGAGDHGS